MGSTADNRLTLSTLEASWVRSLRAANRADTTITSYVVALGQLIDYFGDQPVDEVTTDDIRGFLASMVDTHASATVRQRYASLKQFWKWALEEGEIDSNPMARVKAPKVVEQPVPVLTDDQIKKLIAAAMGNEFTEARDTAIIYVLLDCGIRLAELVGMRVEDLDWSSEQIVVKGKGGRLRAVSFGRTTAKALDKYERRRRVHPEQARPEFWLGAKGPLTGSGIHQALNRRAKAAGIPPISAHQFRHSFAHKFLENGGNEGDLQELAGWQSPQMLRRYGRSAAAARAKKAHRRYSPADNL